MTKQTKAASKVVTINDNKESILFNVDTMHSAGIKAIRALQAESKKRGEADSQLIVAMLSAYRSGIKSVNTMPQEIADQTARNTTLLVQCFEIATLDVNTKGKSKLIPADKYTNDDIAKVKTAVNRVTPIVMHIIAKDAYHLISLSSDGLLKVKGSLLLGKEVLDKVQGSSDREFVMNGKIQDLPYVPEGEERTRIEKVKKSFNAFSKFAMNELNLEKATRKPKVKGAGKPVASLVQAIDFVSQNIAGKQADDFSPETQGELKNLMLELLRMNHFTDVIVEGNDALVSVDSLING